MSTNTINANNTITTLATAYNPDGSVAESYNLTSNIILHDAGNLHFKINDYPAAGNVYIKKHVKSNLALFEYTN